MRALTNQEVDFVAGGDGAYGSGSYGTYGSPNSSSPGNQDPIQSPTGPNPQIACRIIGDIGDALGHVGLDGISKAIINLAAQACTQGSNEINQGVQNTENADQCVTNGNAWDNQTQSCSAPTSGSGSPSTQSN